MSSIKEVGTTISDDFAQHGLHATGAEVHILNK